MDKKSFFDKVRQSLFHGKLHKSQVEGMESLLDMYESENWSISWRAYSLATAYHETGQTMQPIGEWGGVRYFDKYDTGKLAKALGNTPEKDGDGYKWRGRGIEMVTGYDNYLKAEKATGIPFTENPDLMFDIHNAVKVHAWGGKTGAYTGKKWADYLPNGEANLEQFRQARRVINGLDKALKIANYALKFQEALK